MLSTFPAVIRKPIAWCGLSSRTSSVNEFGEDIPLRDELYNLEQLEKHARDIAATDQLAMSKKGEKLLPRLGENESLLLETYDLIATAAANNRRIAPAAEWLLDNFYLIESNIRSVKRLLPKSYSTGLPRLANGSSANYPRIYAIALELIAHTDGRVDADSLNAFVHAYQAVTPLQLGELWALPLMLRLAIIENLRRIAIRMARSRCHRDLANDWAQTMNEAIEKSPTELIISLAGMARANPPMSGAFLSDFTRQLHGNNSNLVFVNSWLEHRISDQGLTLEQLILAEGQDQAAHQVSVGNSINSLRMLDIYDWREFVSTHSLVEQTLAEDPAGIYMLMDFATRNRYRRAVEAIAKRSTCSEYDVAHRAIQLAKVEQSNHGNTRSAHVGYFLVDRGRLALEGLVRMQVTPRVLLDKIRRLYPLCLYFFLALALTILLTTVFGKWSGLREEPLLLHLALVVPIFLGASQLALALTNWLSSKLICPQPLSRMDYRKGITADNRTIVVVPTMLSSLPVVEQLIEGLEIRYLANREDHLHFALLTDFSDADQKEMPTDAALLKQASDGIALLNKKYPVAGRSIFFLMHRERSWNAVDGIWMGHERKRGKLADLNAVLRGKANRFKHIVGDPRSLDGVRYVITLDTDTQLPRNAAREMIEAMAHPLNRPCLDGTGSRVKDGYAIMQPRVEPNLPTSLRSWFSKLHSGDLGIDPYTLIVSDVYQDLFGEGSFIGKGIYDIDFFERLCGYFPENTILSHDLLEGCHGRCALISDVILYEDYPSSYAIDVSRRHRWIRGDWQILGWLFPRVRGSDGGWVKNPVSDTSQWKIFDNLRRSLVAPSLLALLTMAWLAGSPSLVLASTLFVAVIFVVPATLGMLTDLALKPKGASWLYHWGNSLALMARHHLAQSLIWLIFLPHEAILSLDAIGRTLFRMYWTKKKLLEWTTSCEVNRNSRSDLAGFTKMMWPAPVVSTLLLVDLWLYRPAVFWTAAPLLWIWFFSPAIAWCLSRPLSVPKLKLVDSQKVFLRKVARKTWRFFESFVTAEDNWLPPDNVQTDSGQKIASRTSPTNIAMALASDLSAHDFGYCSTTTLLKKTCNTFETMAKLEKHRGHFFNWYDTRSLAPLKPLYVSTVDSGNLAAHLLILASGFREMTHAPIASPNLLSGLRDTLSILLDEAKAAAGSRNGTASMETDGNTLRKLQSTLEDIAMTRGSLTALHRSLTKWHAEAIGHSQKLHQEGEVRWWSSAWERICLDHLTDLNEMAPWISIPALPEGWQKELAAETCKPLTALLNDLTKLHTVPTLSELVPRCDILVSTIDSLLQGSKTSQNLTCHLPAMLETWLKEARGMVSESSTRALSRVAKLESLALQCEEFASMDFTFLENKTRDLFAIGYNLTDNRQDASCYDLLASEARLATFILIAQGQVSQEHWFSLGRLLTSTGGGPALLSWSGSMFEYLMPRLVMPTFSNTLLDQTYHSIVRRQINYGRQRGVPWGFSESGYNAFDQLNNYQYMAFGVPGTGLKRGLADSLVVAPYASALALVVAPDAACKNLQRLADDGFLGAFGFYEAIDYTPSRLPPGEERILVCQFMAHHAGMSLMALVYALLDQPMQRRFMANPQFRAAILLLQERVPKTTVPVFPHATEASVTRAATAEDAGTMRIFSNPGSPVPEVHLLSNGNYHVMVTSAGGGYSRWGDMAVTRWRSDTTRDCWGSFCYLRDTDTGFLWSNTWHPTGSNPQTYEAIFTQSRAEFRRSDERIDVHTQITVSAEDDLELRRITITNRSDKTRTVELTSYSEVVLASQGQDEAHPAFSNLFVQTEITPSRKAILCTRRPRSKDDKPVWMVHLLAPAGETLDEPSFETDRMRFIGRGYLLAKPKAFDQIAPLSNSQGSVLDPIASIRQTIRIPPGESAAVDLVTGIAQTRDAALAIAAKYSDVNLANRSFELAWTRGLIMLRQLNITESEAQMYGRLAGSIVYPSGFRRAKPATIIRNRRGQSGLWGHGISGDLPIVLLQVHSREKIDIVRQMVQAHGYWRLKGLKVDLVIWNEDNSEYRQAIQDLINDIISISTEAVLLDRTGGVFVCRAKQISEEDRWLLQSAACVILKDDAGTLEDQVNRSARLDWPTPPLQVTKRRLEPIIAGMNPNPDLVFNNDLGGFSRDGREYIMVLKPGKNTPAPWVNVIANPHLGTVVSESGSSYTWMDNSHEFRLTPWNNDPVSDPSGEAFYIRDEQSGRYWSPAPLPARGRNTYLSRHGFGYSVFEYAEDGIFTEQWVYVDPVEPVKFIRIKFTNRSERRRNLSITGIWELVLGESRGKNQMHVFTELDPVTGAVFAKNPYNPDFSSRVAFVDCNLATRSVTGDRTEVIGRNGTLTKPAIMDRLRLSNRTGAAFDPCIGMHVPFDLNEGQEKIIVFIFGASGDEAESRKLVQQFRSDSAAQSVLEGVWTHWNHTLGAVHIESPDPAVDYLVNGWLIYQTISCRMWARTGFYQSGGAYGFRDQLQDAMALVHTRPELLKAQLLRAAARQFREGDVQHWWHPPTGRGVRTHFSDDFLWLPLALCRYVQATRDEAILEEKVPYLVSRLLRQEEEANYEMPTHGDSLGSMYEHAVKAIENGLKFGVHGLPLMGCGDWNDGMNLVGLHGRGESVWLAFFLYEVLNQFAKLAGKKGDAPLSEKYTLEAGRIRGNIEKHAWDGEWYRRAYFDDGTPLGSAQNEECQIDSISQSWSILSGAGMQDRFLSAIKSVEKRLVKREAALIQLLDPPFDKSLLDPGYIKGYAPGVRENGGQYTHGAIWTIMAFATIGEVELAWDLLKMINPISHGDTAEAMARYRVEPYVMAADVYSVDPHTGRGGWTWYTGSAGWMYRLIVESLLGLHLEGDKLRVNPRLPRDWPTLTIDYRYKSTLYHIQIKNSGAGSTIKSFTVNDLTQDQHEIKLADDQGKHAVVIEMD
jgi:cellobiose phosphorylase